MDASLVKAKGEFEVEKNYKILYIAFKLQIQKEKKMYCIIATQHLLEFLNMHS